MAKTATFTTEEFGELVFKTPGRAAYQRFIAQIRDDKCDDFVAMMNLIKSCAVKPDAAELDGIIDDAPGLVSEVAGKLTELAAPSYELTVKIGS